MEKGQAAIVTHAEIQQAASLIELIILLLLSIDPNRTQYRGMAECWHLTLGAIGHTGTSGRPVSLNPGLYDMIYKLEESGGV